MEANELRIGNLISLSNRICKIAEIYTKGCLVYDLEDNQDTLEDFERIKPIPLTEEWLTKFGFKKNNMYWIDDTNIGFEFYKNGNIKWNQPHNIKYVHELQNLFFIFTRKELCIELEKENQIQE